MLFLYAQPLNVETAWSELNSHYFLTYWVISFSLSILTSIYQESKINIFISDPSANFIAPLGCLIGISNSTKVSSSPLHSPSQFSYHDKWSQHPPNCLDSKSRIHLFLTLSSYKSILSPSLSSSISSICLESLNYLYKCEYKAPK